MLMNMYLHFAKKLDKNSQALLGLESQFGYCPLICMFHGRWLNNKINHLHECLLPIVHKDNNSSFKDPLKKDNSFTIHHRDIQSLAIELCKAKENL